VIVPAHTFIATPHAMAHQGAIPVFCDIDERTYNIDPAKIEELVTERTKAIVAVHLYGLPADMDEIHAIANRHGLAVIEDAAQSHGATYKGKKTGTLAASAGFSLNATKNLSGGEGGLFVTDDEDLFTAGRRLSVFGEDVVATGPDEFRSYVSHSLGWNYRNQEMSSAFARSQLRRLDEYNATAQANAKVLAAGLAKLDGVSAPYIPEDRTSVHHKYRVTFDAQALGFDGPPEELRDRFVHALRAEGVEAALWQVDPLPDYPAFRKPLATWTPGSDEGLAPIDPESFPATRRALANSFILASERHPLFVQEQELMESYVGAVEKVLANLDELVAQPFEPVALR